MMPDDELFEAAQRTRLDRPDLSRAVVFQRVAKAVAAGAPTPESVRLLFDDWLCLGLGSTADVDAWSRFLADVSITAKLFHQDRLWVYKARGRWAGCDVEASVIHEVPAGDEVITDDTLVQAGER